MAVAAAAAPIQLENDRIVMENGNITSLAFLNPGNQDVKVRGNLELGQRNISTCAFINGTKCSNLGASNVQDTYIDESGDTMTGELNMSWNNITDIGADGITIADGQGDLDLEGNRLEDLGTYDSSDDAMARTDILSEFVDSAGDTMSGDLDLAGHDLQNVDNIGNGTDAIDVTSNLDLENNNIQNFFGSPCGSGQAVQDIGDAGGFTCVDLSSDVSDTFVNESGDTMSGDLDMGGNDIDNIKSFTGDSAAIAVNNKFDMSNNRIENLQTADSTDDVMTKNDIQSSFVDIGGDTMTGDLKLGGYNLVNVDALSNGTARTLEIGS
ncbi:MAG: hypothetical protein SVU88_03375, partial [Candidatus Nanohaloarchaea archaeon]|nr:hypothetical protein [Candidatus Nanohaloarchaea archaeon]